MRWGHAQGFHTFYDFFFFFPFIVVYVYVKLKEKKVLRESSMRESRERERGREIKIREQVHGKKDVLWHFIIIVMFLQ